jgi:hypothetical protein
MWESSYWQRRASPWVSAAVLAGGLTTAIILFFLVRIETGMQSYALQDEFAIVDER